MHPSNKLLSLCAAIVCVLPLQAHAATDASDFASISLVHDGYTYAGSTFASEVENTGFSFELKGGGSYAYTLTLEVGSDFASQTGLVGYDVGIKIGGSPSWYKLTAGGDPQTYKLGTTVTLSDGQYWLRLEPLSSGTTGTQALILSSVLAPSPTPAVPEPETYAMMLAGLGVIGALARRRQAAQR